jgi:general L-amino acid transport system permease protein
VRAHAFLKTRLFATPFDAALTVGALAVLVVALPPIVDWLVIDADWVGSTRQDCRREGACWVFIGARFWQFVYGFYPSPERWRVDVGFLLIALCIAPLFIRGFKAKAALALSLGIVVPAIAYVFFYGGVRGLPAVETEKWGGLMVTLIVAGVGIAASLPLGVLLALGRASNLPLIRLVSIAFIEVWRGVPLITVLFMTAVMLPLFLPDGVTFDKFVRALIGVSIFAAAYMAEVVRGGLQAVPKGQAEAAASLGLGYWRTMAHVVLPQALRIVIPGIVNVFIALFKDTTLVLIIGLFDLLGIIKAALTDPNWLGFAIEGYVFAGVVFWVFCFAMSRYSARLEARLGGARKT